MSSKLFWVDLETTGLQPGHEITECAFIIDIDGEAEEERSVLVRPLAVDPKNVESGEARPIDENALATTGLTMEDLKDPERKEPRVLYRGLSNILETCVDKFNRSDKFIIAGHNVDFDVRFLKALWDQCGDRYFGSWFSWETMNLVDVLRIWQVVTGKQIQGRKLTDIAEAFDVSLVAHKAINDIKATRELFYRMLDDIRGTS